MNILILNGSPRVKGNTATACAAVADGIRAHLPQARVEEVVLDKLHIAPCKGCDACKRNGGTCVQKDDAPACTQKMLAADMVIFATPVYWWGMTAQLKLALDRMYMQGAALGKQRKQIGVIAIGGAGTDDPEYRLIREQFTCICNYLDWKLSFAESIAAYNPGDLAGNAAAMRRLGGLWQQIEN